MKLLKKLVFFSALLFFSVLFCQVKSVSADRDNITGICPTGSVVGLLSCQDFEATSDAWEGAFRSGVWNAPSTNLVRRVQNKCLSGNSCIRSNLRGTIIDPITGQPGNPNLQFEWAPSISGMDEVFLRYWYRLDNALWQGVNDSSNVIRGASTIGKLVFITDQAEGTTAYFMGGLGNTFAENGAYTGYYTDHPELWGQYYELGGRTQFYGANTSWIAPPDGVWHKFEIYANHNEDYVRVWIDDVPFVASNSDGPTDGLIHTHPDFRLRGLQFWYTREAYLRDSVNGPETAGGFELDNLEVWDRNIKSGSAQTCSNCCSSTQTCPTAFTSVGTCTRCCASACQNASTDTTVPRVTAFSITPTTLTVGASLTANYTVTDNIALARAELWRAPSGTNCTDTVKTGCTWTQITSANITGTTRTGTLSSSPTAAGTFYYGLHAVDSSNNVGYESSAQRVVVSAQGSPVYHIGSDGDYLTWGAFRTAVRTPASGSDVLFKRGETHRTISGYRRFTVDWSGTVNDNVIIGAYGTGAKPILDGQDLYPGTAPCTDDICWAALVDASSQRYVTIENLRVINVEGTGIQANTNVSSINIKNCETFNTYRMGISIGASLNANSLIEGCVVEEAVMVWPEYTKANGGGWPAALTAIRSTHVTIRNNIVRNVHGEGIGLFSNSPDPETQTKNCVIEGNTVIGARAAGIYVGGSAYNIIRNNSVLGTTDTTYHRSGGFVGTGLLLADEVQTGANNTHHNELYNNLVAYTGACFEVGGNDDTGNVGDIKFYNNTCVSNRYNIHAWSAGPLANHYNLDIRNNIFACIPGDNCTQVGIFKKAWISVIDYNYHTTAPDATYLGVHSVVNSGNPVVKTSGWQAFNSSNSPTANDFKQISQSNAIDRGLNLGSAYALDYFGGSRPYGSSWDIGVHEYAATPQTCTNCCGTTQTCATAFTTVGTCTRCCATACQNVSTDTTAPRVTAFTITPTTLTVGASLTANYTVTDNVALARAELWRAPQGTNCTDTVKTGCTWTQITSANITGTTRTGTLSSSPTAAGIFYYGLHAVDTSNNVGYESAAVRVTVNAATTCSNCCSSTQTCATAFTTVGTCTRCCAATCQTPPPPPPPVECTDNDGDRYISENNSAYTACGLICGSAKTQACIGYNDCNDNNIAIHYGATDICGNSIDEDCSGADTVCAGGICQKLDSSSSIPSGYGAPYNVLSVNREQMIRTICNAGSVGVSLGNNSVNQYIWRYAYLWRNNAWQQVNLSGTTPAYGGNWFRGNANGSVNLTATELANQNNLVAFICNWNSTLRQWKCGCRDANCTTAYWQLQRFGNY